MMPDWLCGPHTCFMAAWVYDFQTLLTGILAIFAAGVAVLVPERYRQRAERNAQIDRGSVISTEIGLMGSQIAATILQIQSLRQQERDAIILTLELPSLNTFIKDAKALFESVRDWLTGPDQDILVTVSWRLASFRSAVDRASTLARIFETEAHSRTFNIVEDHVIEGIVRDLNGAGSAELPPAMRAALRNDQEQSRRRQRQR
jgi:hypothetical protein